MKAAFLLIPLLLAGCVTGNTPQSPPSTFDKALLSVQTNIVTQTNFVWQTNLSVVTVTNTANQVVTTTNTNTVFVPQIVQQTNYVYSPNPVATGTIQAVAPLGGAVGTAVGYGLTGLLGIFAYLKNRQASKLAAVAGVSQQALATAQQVIAALPNGQALLGQFNAWLAEHQTDVDFANELVQIVNTYVEPTRAATTAAGIVAQATPAK